MYNLMGSFHSLNFFNYTSKFPSIQKYVMSIAGLTL